MSFPAHSIRIGQSELVHTYQIDIPVELRYDVAAISISSSKNLTPDLIQWIYTITIEAAIYTHIGFGTLSAERSAALTRKFQLLDRDQTTFTVYAWSSGGRGKNIVYPGSFSRQR